MADRKDKTYDDLYKGTEKRRKPPSLERKAAYAYVVLIAVVVCCGIAVSIYDIYQDWQESNLIYMGIGDVSV